MKKIIALLLALSFPALAAGPTTPSGAGCGSPLSPSINCATGGGGTGSFSDLSVSGAFSYTGTNPIAATSNLLITATGTGGDPGIITPKESDVALGLGIYTNRTKVCGSTAIGSYALASGDCAGFYSTGGTAPYGWGMHNIGIGLGALYRISATAGTSNILSGIGAGGYNIAIGYLTMNNIRAATENAIVGDHAFQFATDASGNASLGNHNGQSVTTGNYNTLLGYDVATALTTGSQNVIIAPFGAPTLQTGSGNILIGTSNATDTAATSTSNTLKVQGSGAVPTLYSDNINSSTPNLAIGAATVSANAVLDLSGQTNSLLLPTGTTGQRPTATAGMVRYNSTSKMVEGYLAATGTARWASIHPSPSPKAISGVWISSILSNLTSTVVGNAGRLYAIPFIIPDYCSPCTIDQAAISVATTPGGAGAEGKVGLYNSSASGETMGSLLGITGTIALTSLGGQSASFTSALTLYPGKYWAVTTYKSATPLPTVRGPSGTVGQLSSLIGNSATADVSAQGYGYYKTQAYDGTMPDPFGTPTGVITSSADVPAYVTLRVQ